MRIYGCKNETQARTLIRVIARTMSLGTAKCYSVKRTDYSGPGYKSPHIIAWEIEWSPDLYIAQWNRMRTREEAKAGRSYDPRPPLTEEVRLHYMGQLAAYCRGFDYAAKRTDNPGW